MKGKIILWCVVLVLVMGWGAPATGETYCNYLDYGGTWNDVNKTGVTDSEMCWAATASNILAWGGWGTARYSTAGEIYDYIKSCYANYPSTPYEAYSFWFYGSVGGGGFYPGYSLNDYHHYGSPMQNIATFLQAGQGVHIRVETPGAVHAITVWGYDYNPAYSPEDNGYYTHLYFTDSDDHVTELQHSPIRWDETVGTVGRWVFDGGRYEGWRIEYCTGLERDPYIDLPGGFFWVGKKAFEGFFDLRLFLSFDLKWEPPFPEPQPGDPCKFLVQIETVDDWLTIYQLDLEQSEMDWQSLNIPINKELMGLQKLRFLVEGDAEVCLYRLHPVPLPNAIWLLGSGLLGLAGLGRRKSRKS